MPRWAAHRWGGWRPCPAEDRIAQTEEAGGGTTDDEPCGELNVVRGWLLPPPQAGGRSVGHGLPPLQDCASGRRALLLQMPLEDKRRCLGQGRPHDARPVG